MKEVFNNNLEIKKTAEIYKNQMYQCSQQIDEFQDVIRQKGEQVQALIIERDSISREIEGLRNHLEDIKEQQTAAAEAIYDTAKAQVEESFDREMERLSCELDQTRAEVNATYLELLHEAQNNYLLETQKNQEEVALSKRQLADIRNQLNAAIEAAKRAKEIEEKDDFYRLKLSLVDQTEIKRLREILPYLRDKEPLNKVIYKCYYEKPYTDLIGRVIGQEQKTGIYKITNIKDKKCYVGQAVNIAERWRQHIKRGVGAETPTRNKLYPVMYELGPENFTFEIIEECPTDKLNEREQYWQEFYHAKDWGYSIK